MQGIEFVRILPRKQNSFGEATMLICAGGSKRFICQLLIPSDVFVFVKNLHGLPNFGALDRNDAARPHQIKIESDAARNKPRRAHAPCPHLEIYNACFVHFL